MTTKEKEIFTTEEAAEMMGCAPSTIEEYARNRVLPGLRMGHEWRFPREAFMKAINTLAITGELHRKSTRRAVQAVANTKERRIAHHLLTPFTFSKVRAPAMPSMPVRMTHSASVSSMGGCASVPGIHPLACISAHAHTMNG